MEHDSTSVRSHKYKLLNCSYSTCHWENEENYLSLIMEISSYDKFIEKKVESRELVPTLRFQDYD